MISSSGAAKIGPKCEKKFPGILALEGRRRVYGRETLLEGVAPKGHRRETLLLSLLEGIHRRGRWSKGPCGDPF